MGFIINPDDPFVANMTVNNAQCTVCSHVDNLKTSHIDEAIVTALSDFGSSLGAIIVSMIKYPTKVLDKWLGGYSGKPR